MKSKTLPKLEFLVAMKCPDDPMPYYYIPRKRWTANPRKAAFLSQDSADRTLASCECHRRGVKFAIVPISNAIRLWSLQKRRGDIRSLESPEEPGVPLLTARSKD